MLHSLDPWFLARHQPNLERTACNSLARAGFECWYPTYLDVRSTPLRKLTASKRRVAHLHLMEIRKPRFPGYLMLRPLAFARHDINRLFELPGCRGLVSLGGKVARIEDYDVELMRLAEAKGTFDVHAGVGRYGRFRVTAAAPDTRWEGQGKRLLALREARKLQLTVDALGRVASLIEQANGSPPMAAGRYHETIQVKSTRFRGKTPGGA